MRGVRQRDDNSRGKVQNVRGDSSVISPDGTHLGTIVTGEVTANVAFGDDGRTLYMTASSSLYRVRLSTEGHIPGP